MSNAPRALRPFQRLAPASALAALIAASSLGAAHADATLGYAWANAPQTFNDYSPPAAFSYNSSGGAITVQHGSLGAFTVLFAGLEAASDKSDVQVSAYQSNGYCISSGWAPNSAAEEVGVSCYDATGALADLEFTVLFQTQPAAFGDTTHGLAFLWANEPTTKHYTPAPQFNFNSLGGQNSLKRTATGLYTAHLPGLDKIGGDVLVTAYGEPSRCKAVQWSQDVKGTDVDVACFDPSGAAADERFTLLYSRGLPLGYQSGATSVGAYAWANKSGKASYTPPKTYQFNNASSGSLTATHTAKGAYVVTIPAASNPNSITLATGVGADNTYCSVAGWTPMNINCYAQGGRAANAQFDAAYVAKP